MKEGSSTTTQPIRQELQAALTAAETLPRADLPRFVGDLEGIRAVAFARLIAPTPVQQPPDELLAVQEAARRLCVSRDFLYRHHRRLPFSRRMGRSLLFSAQGIQKYIQRGHAPGAARRWHGGSGAVKKRTPLLAAEYSGAAQSLRVQLRSAPDPMVQIEPSADQTRLTRRQDG